MVMKSVTTMSSCSVAVWQLQSQHASLPWRLLCQRLLLDWLIALSGKVKVDTCLFQPRRHLQACTALWQLNTTRPHNCGGSTNLYADSPQVEAIITLSADFQIKT